MTDLGGVASYRVPSYRKQLDIWAATNAVAQARSVRIGNFVRWVPVWRNGLTGTIPLLRYRADGVLAGTVTENGTPIPYAVVAVYYRPTMQLITTARCDGSGAFSVPRLDPADTHAYFIVAFDPDGGTLYNALVYDRLTPVGDSASLVRTIAASGFDAAAYGTYIDGDPYYQSVALLLHGSGSNGSTDITDSSSSPKIVTAGGGAQISTAQSKFDGSSIYFNGASGTKLTIPTGDYFDFTGDFTCECFVRFDSTASFPEIITVDGATGIHAGHGLGVSTGLKLAFSTRSASDPASAAAASIVGTTSVSAGIWYHVAVTRAGNVYRLFLDGIQEATTTSATAVKSPAGRSAVIGQYYDNTERLDGYLDEFRFTKGVARYTANFTPPAAAFKDW